MALAQWTKDLVADGVEEEAVKDLAEEEEEV
jgi:hypothetical protein